MNNRPHSGRNLCHLVQAFKRVVDGAKHTGGVIVSLGKAFCVVCGAEDELTKERLCVPCFKDRTKLSILPETIQGFRCPKCMMCLHSGRWGHHESDEYHEGLVQEALEVEGRTEALGIGIMSEEIDERNTRLSVQVTGYIDEVKFEDIHSSIARISNSVCPTCTRKAGNYFEATVQLRSSGRKLTEDELSSLRTTFDTYLEGIDPDPMFFISSEGNVTGGYDMVLGSKALARSWTKHLLRKFGGTTKETNSVVGRKDGEDLTRLTISYRKPAFNIGDVIRKQGRYWQVHAWQKDGAVISSIDRQERTGLTWRDLEKTSVESQSSEHLEVEILKRDSSAADFMDPNDWKVRTVSLPYDDDGSQGSLRIALIADEWVALPRTTGGAVSE
jgi:nonsense-mediated mRNA decay protein 3